MVRRLIDEWRDGVNRFDKPGERAYYATAEDRIVGVCGLNVDPYANDGGVGRIRRLYVATHFRRRGIARAILQRLIADASGVFRELHLRTHDPQAGAFYEAIGFARVSEDENC